MGRNERFSELLLVCTVSPTVLHYHIRPTAITLYSLSNWK